MLNERLTGQILGAAITVHKELGPGLLESTYEACLCHELSQRRIAYQRQVGLPIVYKGLQLPDACRLDVAVEDAVVLELKAVEQMIPVYEAQLLTYLRLSGKKVGFLINFNVVVLKDGITRRVL
jgi:GxxExxY protein